MNPKILSEMTGRTHGIKFKMKPPMKPKNRNVSRPREGTGAVEAATGNSREKNQPVRFSSVVLSPATTMPLIRFGRAPSKGTWNITSPLRDSTFG